MAQTYGGDRTADQTRDDVHVGGASTSTVTTRRATTRPTTAPRFGTRDTTETRKAFRTTEFWIFIGLSAGVLISGYADGDSLTRWRTWLLVCVLGVAYMVSRGLAKAGSYEPEYHDADRD
jgi:hypothetical protein